MDEIRHGRRWRIMACAAAEGGDGVQLYSPEAAESSKRFRAEHGLPGEELPTAPATYFDELVIHPWLHLECMDPETGHWWMQLADARVDIFVGEDGKAEIEITRGEYGR